VPQDFIRGQGRRGCVPAVYKHRGLLYNPLLTRGWTIMPPTSPDSPASRLLARLTGPLDRPTAEGLVAALEAAGQTGAAAGLLDELEEASAKAVRAALEAWPELHRRGAAGALLPWLDLGVSLAASSGAVALRYFNDSPLVLGLIEPASSRASVLQAAL